MGSEPQDGDLHHPLDRRGNLPLRPRHRDDRTAWQHRRCHNHRPASPSRPLGHQYRTFRPLCREASLAARCPGRDVLMAVQGVDAPSSAMPREEQPNLERPNVLRRYPQFTISPAIFCALLAAWWFATDVLGAPAYVLPPPEQVLRAMIGGLSRAPWDKA